MNSESAVDASHLSGGHFAEAPRQPAASAIMSDILKNNLIMYPKALLRTSFVILNNIYCLPTYVIWMTLLLPVKRYQPDLYYRIEGLFFHWLLSLVAMWSYTAGYGVVEVGDDLTPCRRKDARTLIIANHQSTADVPLMMTCFNAKPDILPNIMWIMERLFKYTNFGVVSLIHQDFFISSGRDNRDSSVQSLKDHINNSFIPRMRNWMVLFPEGGFLHKRKEVSRRYAAKNNLPDLQNVSLPRVGALKAIFSVLPPVAAPANNNTSPVLEERKEKLVVEEEEVMVSKTNCGTNGVDATDRVQPAVEMDALKQRLVDELLEKPAEKQSLQQNGSNGKAKEAAQSADAAPHAPSTVSAHLDYILDITIAYPKGKPLDLPSIVTGMRESFDTHFLYRLFPTSQIPKDEEGLTKWLFDRWSEKEQLLAEFYRTGQFHYPGGAMVPQLVQQDMLRFVIINLFFITSSYVHLQMFYAVLGYCNSLCLYTML